MQESIMLLQFFNENATNGNAAAAAAGTLEGLLGSMVGAIGEL
jgi:hypothetical protein